MGIVMVFLFLVIIPFTIGIAFAKMISLKGSTIYLSALPMGFFIELAVFQLVTLPWAMINLSFSSLCITISVILLIGCVFSICQIKKNIVRIKHSFSAWEWIYGIIAILLISFQVFHMAYSDIGYWSSDDAIYGAVANDALSFNVLFRQNALTGVASTMNLHRAMQSSLLLPAFLSFFSRIPVATVYHTVLGVYYLLLAYSVYMLLGKVLFKTVENTFVFLIILSVLYIFGLYTIYSQTYRLLGPSTQGKAVLAVCFFPFLYTLMIIKVPEKYNWKMGLLLLLLSASASSMTMFGAITMVGNTIFPVVVSLFSKNRNWKNICYVLWGCVLPAFYGGLYFYSKFAP